jgi:crotonobetainyl-CoA:carnitine CoA-transferase CaiB-like acyl-CoA transferase
MRILDLSSNSLAASAATCHLALLGAEVWKVEYDETGDPLRCRAPVRDGTSIPFAWTGRGKRWAGVRRGAEAIAALAAAADVLVASDPAAVAGLEETASVVLVTPFGTTGPRSPWKAHSFSLFHVSGAGYVTPRASITGDSEGAVAPQAPWGHVAEYFGGIFAAIGIAAAAAAGRHTTFDLSLQECLVPLLRRETGAWQYDGYRASRSERLWKVAPSGMYATQDGYVYVSVVEDGQWHRLCDLIGRPELKSDPRLTTGEDRFVHLDLVNEALGGWLAQQRSVDAFERGCLARVPIGHVQGPVEIRTCAQLADRRAIEHSVGLGNGPVLPIRAAGAPPTRSPPWDEPQPGRDTRAVLAAAGWADARVDRALATGAVFAAGCGRRRAA